MTQAQSQTQIQTPSGKEIRRRIIEEVVKYMISEKTIILSYNDLWNISETISKEFSISEDESRWMVKETISVYMNSMGILDGEGFEHYMILPNMELTEEEEKFIRTLLELTINPIEGARIPKERGDMDIDYVVSYYFFRTRNNGLIFGDPLAWYMRKVAQSYSVEPDEEIIEWENKESGTWSKILRYGDTKIRVKKDYTNINVEGVGIGVDVGTFYEFVQ